MRTWVKQVGLATAAVLSLVILGVVVEHVRGRWGLHRRIKQLEAQSEHVSVSSAEPKHPPADQNAFGDIAKVTNRLSTLATEIGQAPPSLRFAGPGRAIVASRLTEWSGERNLTNDWARLGMALEDSRDVLDLLEAAVQKPAYDSGFNYQKGFVDFQIGQLAQVKSAASLLSAATLYALERKRLDGAFRSLNALVLLTAKQTPEPLVIAQLVRIACAAIAFNATWQALQSEGWNETQLAALQAAWERCDFIQDMARAFEVERAMDHDFFAQVKQSRPKLEFALAQREKAQAMLEGINEPPAASDTFVRDWISVPLWRVAWADQDALRSLNRWQHTIERERFARTNSWTALSSPAGENQRAEMPAPVDDEKLNRFDRLRFLFSSEQFSITDSMIRRAYSTQTQQQLAIAALAIARYQLRAGKAPPDLQALQPDYLTAVPRDWMDGKRLRYRLLADGRFVLYSVGEDGKDDGGDPSPHSNPRGYRRFWDGRDALWPAAATDAEAAEAMKPATR